MTTPHVVLDRLSVRFGAQIGLRDLSLSINAGERVALLGPSGVGKSSLLRTMAGLEDAASGTLRLGARDVTALEPRERGVVYLHQRPLLFPHLSVEDNVAFPLTVRGVSTADARVQARALLAQVQLADVATRASTALSGGQQHRVALARALAADPILLLLDEPFAALDPSLRVDVRDTVQQVLRARGLTTLLVTHDVDEAVRFADRLAILQAGRVVQFATSAELLQRPASVAIARFLGLPNVFPAVPLATALGLSLGEIVSYDGLHTDPWLVARASAFTIAHAEKHEGIPAHVVGRIESVEGTRWQVVAAGQTVTAIAGPAVTPLLGDAVRLLVQWPEVHLLAPPDATPR